MQDYLQVHVFAVIRLWMRKILDSNGEVVHFDRRLHEKRNVGLLGSLERPSKEHDYDAADYVEPDDQLGKVLSSIRFASKLNQWHRALCKQHKGWLMLVSIRAVILGVINQILPASFIVPQIAELFVLVVQEFVNV